MQFVNVEEVHCCLTSWHRLDTDVEDVQSNKSVPFCPCNLTTSLNQIWVSKFGALEIPASRLAVNADFDRVQLKCGLYFCSYILIFFPAPYDTTPSQRNYGSYANWKQPYYGNNYQQTAGSNNYATPQTSYYATNQQQASSYANGQVPSSQQDYQAQQG